MRMARAALGFLLVSCAVGLAQQYAISTYAGGPPVPAARPSAATPVLTSAAIPASTWTEITDGLPRTAAGIGNLAMYSAARSTIYARMNSGAIFKSSDGGERWSQISSIAAVRWLVVDPSNLSTIYAGTIHGIVKSTDCGARWNGVNSGLSDSYVNSLVIEPLTPSTLYAATSDGDIFKSVDGGGSWNVIGTLDGVSDLVIHPTNPSIMYAAAAGRNGGLFKSTDSGATWTAANPGHAFRIEGIHLAFDPVSPSAIYLAYIDYETPPSSVPVGQIAKSMDGGSSWNPANTGLSSRAFFGGLSIDPLTGATIYAVDDDRETGGGKSILKSTDGGSSWKPINSGIPSDRLATSLVLDRMTPGTLFAGYSAPDPDGSSGLKCLFKSNNGGAVGIRSGRGWLLSTSA